MLLTNSTSWVELELTQYLQNPTSILLRKDRKPSNSDSTEIQKIFKIWNSQFLQSKISKLNLQKCCSLIFQLIKTGNFTDLIQASSQKIVPEEQLLWSYLFKKITLHNQFLFVKSTRNTLYLIQPKICKHLSNLSKNKINSVNEKKARTELGENYHGNYFVSLESIKTIIGN